MHPFPVVRIVLFLQFIRFWNFFFKYNNVDIFISSNALLSESLQSCYGEFHGWTWHVFSPKIWKRLFHVMSLGREPKGDTGHCLWRGIQSVMVHFFLEYCDALFRYSLRTLYKYSILPYWPLLPLGCVLP